LIKKRYVMNPAPETPAEHELRRLRTLYRALGDETRLRMIGLLAEIGPMPVNELSSRVGLSQPLISWHLRILRLAGVVDTQRQGRTTICRLRTAAFEELHDAEARLVAGTAGVANRADAPGTVPDVS
jgi:ArsR family transcriptional regulator